MPNWVKLPHKITWRFQDLVLSSGVGEAGLRESYRAICSANDSLRREQVLRFWQSRQRSSEHHWQKVQSGHGCFWAGLSVITANRCSIGYFPFYSVSSKNLNIGPSVVGLDLTDNVKVSYRVVRSRITSFNRKF